MVQMRYHKNNCTTTHKNQYFFSMLIKVSLKGTNFKFQIVCLHFEPVLKNMSQTQISCYEGPSIIDVTQIQPKTYPFPPMSCKNGCFTHNFLSGIIKSGDPPPVDDVKLLSSLIAFYGLRILQTKLKKNRNFLC